MDDPKGQKSIIWKLSGFEKVKFKWEKALWFTISGNKKQIIVFLMNLFLNTSLH